MNVIITNTTLAELVLPIKCEFNNLAKSAANIALYNFHWDYVTLVLYSTASICGISTFIETYSKSIVVGRHMVYPIVPAYTRQIVLFGTNLEDIRKMLVWMKKLKIDNTGNCIVVCESHEVSCDESGAVALLWEFKVTNVIFLKILSSDVVAGYTYFFGKNCAFTPPVKIFDWDFHINQNNNHLKFNNIMFSQKFKNLHGCPLTVSTFVQKPYMHIQDDIPSGADGDFLRIIVQAINASLKLMTPRKGAGWGYLDSNGTWVGSLGDIYYGRANISMTSGAITRSRYQNFQISKNYYFMTVVWVSHPLEEESASMKLLRPLGIKSGTFFVLSLLISLIFGSFLKQNRFFRFRTKIRIGQFPNAILFLCWQVCMGQPVAKIPKQSALMYLILFWIWYSSIIRTFYQVYLIDYLKNDIYLESFANIEDVIRDGYHFGSGAALRDYYIDHPEVLNHWTNIESDDIYKIMLDMSDGKKFVLAMNLATEKVFIKETKKKLFVLPEKVVSSPTVLFFKKYSPLESALSSRLTQLFECGWPQKIYKDNTLPTYKTVLSNDNRPIKLQHFTGCYIIIITGWIVSFGSFILENKIYVQQKR